MLNIFVMYYLMNRKLKTIFFIEIFCNNINVFTDTFDQFNASLQNKSIHFITDHKCIIAYVNLTCKSVILISWCLYGTSIRGKPIFTLASRALLGPIFITCKLIDIVTQQIMSNDSLVLNDIVVCLMSAKIPCTYNWTSQHSSRPTQTLLLQSEMKSERQICRGEMKRRPAILPISMIHIHKQNWQLTREHWGRLHISRAA